MLILVSVSINVVIDGGLFNYTGKAKNSTEIASEKETLQQVLIIAKGSSKAGKITVKELQQAINTVTSEGTAMAIESSGTNYIKFEESKRYYEIDGKGNIGEPKEITSEKYAGDITKGGKCDGSEEKPFKITCIEDLVAFSIMTNGGNTELGLASNKFNGKYVELTKTIDFESIFSYDDYTTTKYGDLNTDGIVEDIRTELTKTDEGCIGFTPICGFKGVFDGKENTIENIYENSQNSVCALFKDENVREERFTIQNLKLTGTITSRENAAAGIYARGYSYNKTEVYTIENCVNYVDVTGKHDVGGIVSACNSGCVISECINYGTITQVGKTGLHTGVGGIVGTSAALVKNCINEGEVVCSYTASGYAPHDNGGIVGSCASGGKIVGCVNKGKTNAGIVRWASRTTDVINCCNVGECTNGIVRSDWRTSL